MTPTGDLGGAEHWLLAMGDATDRLALTVAVLEPGPLVAELAQRGWPTRTHQTGKSIRGMASSALWLSRLMAEVHPAVILLNGVKPGVVALPGAVRHRIPMVLVKHGTAFEGSFTPIVARASTEIVVVSAAQARGLPPTKVRIIAPARPDGVASRLRRRAEPAYCLVMANRLVPNKGVDTAIRALAQCPDWELVVAGADDPTALGERTRLVELARAQGVGDRVRLLGAVADVSALFSAAEAVAVLSRADENHPTPAEGFGLVVLEAASAGIPVIADPAEVPSVAALRGRGVVAVDADDVDSVRRALVDLSSADVRKQLGSAGLAAAAAHPSAEEAADLLADCLSEAAAR